MIVLAFIGGAVSVLAVIVGVELWRMRAWRNPKPWDDDGE